MIGCLFNDAVYYYTQLTATEFKYQDVIYQVLTAVVMKSSVSGM
jgi:hypothetical protein